MARWRIGPTRIEDVSASNGHRAGANPGAGARARASARGRPSGHQALERALRTGREAARHRFRPGRAHRPADRRPDHGRSPDSRLVALHVTRADRKPAGCHRQADRRLRDGDLDVSAPDRQFPLPEPRRRLAPIRNPPGDSRGPDRRSVVAPARSRQPDRCALPESHRAGTDTAIRVDERAGRCDLESSSVSHRRSRRCGSSRSARERESRRPRPRPWCRARRT